MKRVGPTGVPLKKPKEPGEVAPGVWIGSQRSSGNVEYLRYLNITHILSIGVDTLHPTEFKHKRIKGLQDEATADLLSRLEECIEFMEEAIQANTGVLVHCKGGISRSSAVVVAYIMHSNQISADEALARLKEIRPISNPRAEFMEQLRVFERRMTAAGRAVRNQTPAEGAPPAKGNTKRGRRK